MSLSISYIVDTILLSILLNNKRKIITWKESIYPTIKKLLNTGLMCIGMYFVFRLFDFQLDTTRTLSIVILTVVTTLYGILSYWLGSKVFNIKEISIVDDFLIDLKSNLFKRKHIDETV